MTTSDGPTGFELPAPKRITFDHPWNWLSAGLRDIRRSPFVSLSYGALFAAMGCLLTYGLYALDAGFVALPLAAGFMLLGPLLAVGLYEVSRRHAAGEPVSLIIALTAWRRNPGAIFMVGLILMFAFLLWIRIATLLFALFYGVGEFHEDTFFSETFFSFTTVWFLIIGILIGAVLATIVFSFSAIAFPMLIDRKTSATAAILTSVRAALLNWRPLTLWASLITVFSAAGLAVVFVGLIFVLPLIGHASFHAYRDLVEDEG
jgi:uncharacterized membrane protein